MARASNNSSSATSITTRSSVKQNGLDNVPKIARFEAIEKMIAENRLQHEILEQANQQLELQAKWIDEISEQCKSEYKQSVVEVKDSRFENQQIKHELEELTGYIENSVVVLEEKLDELVRQTSEQDCESIAKNVKLVLDHYIRTKFGSEGSQAMNSNSVDRYEQYEEEEESDEDEDEEGEVDEPEDNINGYNDISDGKSVADLSADDRALLGEFANNPQISVGPDGIVKYSLAKDVTTVKTIWQEYFHGVHGGPSIKSLNETYGTKWKLRNENSTFLRRKKIYRAIEYAVMQLGYSEEAAVQEMEDHRVDPDTNKKRAMYWLYDNIPWKFRPG